MRTGGATETRVGVRERETAREAEREKTAGTETVTVPEEDTERMTDLGTEILMVARKGTERERGIEILDGVHTALQPVAPARM